MKLHSISIPNTTIQQLFRDESNESIATIIEYTYSDDKTQIIVLYCEPESKECRVKECKNLEEAYNHIADIIQGNKKIEY